MSTEAITRAESSGSGGRAGDQSAMEDAKTTAKEAASTAKEEAATVVRTVQDQVRTIASDVKSEVKSQSEERSRQAASQLQTFSHQIDALLGGRPQEAGPLPDYLRQGQVKVQAFARRLEQRGPQGLIDDAVSFGRRRPGAFLVMAAGLGFAVGRLARAGAFELSGDSGSSPNASTGGRISGLGSTAGSASGGTGMATGFSATTPSNTREPTGGGGAQ